MHEKNPFSAPEAAVSGPSGDKRIPPASMIVIVAAIIHSLWFGVEVPALLHIVNVGELRPLSVMAVFIASVLLLAGAALLFTRSRKAKIMFVLAAAFTAIALLLWHAIIVMFCFATAIAGAAASYVQFGRKDGLT
jgi:hypothetical protein